MKVCLSSPLLFAYPMEEVFQIAHKLGYEGVEVWHFQLLKTKEDPRRLQKIGRGFGPFPFCSCLELGSEFHFEIRKSSGSFSGNVGRKYCAY